MIRLWGICVLLRPDRFNPMDATSVGEKMWGSRKRIA